MNETFETQFFADNRARLREQLPDGLPIVLTANGLLQRSADTTFSFQQDSSFWYFTGITEPDILLVMYGGTEYLVVPGRSANREAFDGAVDHDMLKRVSGVGFVFDEQQGWEKLSVLTRRSKTMGVLEPAPPYIDAYGMYTNPARRRLTRRLLALKPGLLLEDIRPVVAQMRMVKQPPELAAIRRAIDITCDGLQVVTLPANLKHYRYEYEIEADLNRAFRRTGGAGHAFAPIVSGGKRACTFHNVSNQAPLHKGDLVVIDVGAEYSHYAADMTRTVALCEPTKRQQAVYDAVLDAQRYGISLLKPGAIFRECEAEVRKRVGEHLMALGLTKDTEDKSIARYYPHMPHYLGLDVHDVGDYSRPLEPGMVMTMEPGIYIPEESIGIRIEDDIVITEDGHEIMSKAVPTVLFPDNA